MFDPTKAAADAKAKAETFIRDQFGPALIDAPDGGHALMRAVVDQVFFDAAYHESAGIDGLTEECLDVARQAIERGSAA